jgi:hypothetical protein
VRHLLSVTYVEDGVPQVIVLERSKYSARALIIELELRTGPRLCKPQIARRIASVHSESDDYLWAVCDDNRCRLELSVMANVHGPLMVDAY